MIAPTLKEMKKLVEDMWDDVNCEKHSENELDCVFFGGREDETVRLIVAEPHQHGEPGLHLQFLYSDFDLKLNEKIAEALNSGCQMIYIHPMEW